MDNLCRETLGFTASDALACVESISSLLEARVSARSVDAPDAYKELLRELKRARRKGASSVLPERIWRLPPTEAKQHVRSFVTASLFTDARGIAAFGVDDVAERAERDQRAVHAFLEAFVCDSSDFIEVHHSLPAGAHPLIDKPVLRVEEGYLIPVPHTIRDAIRPRMEALLGEYPDAWEKYAKHRGHWVEEQAASLLGGAFGGASYWTSLGWASNSDNSDLDGLVRCDDVAFRIQCKAGRITAPMRRGAPKRMLEELGELVGDAANQHARLADALAANTAEALGFTAAQSVALRLPLQIEVIVLLDEAVAWATQANRLRDICVLPAGGSVPWVLSLMDLMAVVELLEGAQLLHYWM